MSQKNIRPKAREIWTAFEGEKLRPVLIINDGLSVVEVDVLLAKITSQSPRHEYDIPIEHWQEANLNAPSVVRTTKLTYVHYLQCKRKIGELTSEDFKKVIHAINAFLILPLDELDSDIK